MTCLQTDAQTGQIKDMIKILPSRIGVIAKSVIFRAEYQKKMVAVKAYKNRDPELAKPMELQLMPLFKHENVIKYIGDFRRGNDLYIVMELAQKGDLRAALDKKGDNCTLSWKQKLQIAACIANGLDYLHSDRKGEKPSILHRDLKSFNIGLHLNGNAVILDFDTSKPNPIPATTGTKRKGTYNWMAPEMLDDNAETTTGVDIYGFGMILYELLTNNLPFEKLSNGEIVEALQNGQTPDIPEEHHEEKKTYIEFMKSCWAANSKRPTTAKCVEELTKMLQETEKYPISRLMEEKQEIRVVPPSELSPQPSSQNQPLYDKTTGFVYLAKYKFRDVGVKVFPAKRDYDLLTLRKYDLHHESIENYIGYYQDEKQAYLVLEYIPVTLLDKLKLLKDWSTRLHIASQLVRALQFLHQQEIILRYLHPANILIRENSQIVLSNVFKTAKKVTDIETSLDHTDVRYWAPEVFQDSPTTIATDIYGLGMIFYILFTQHIPWANLPRSKIVGALHLKQKPEFLEVKISQSIVEKNFISLINSCWEENPKERPNLEVIKNQIGEMSKQLVG